MVSKMVIQIEDRGMISDLGDGSSGSDDNFRLSYTKRFIDGLENEI
jgi:hypothetical protein